MKIRTHFFFKIKLFLKEEAKMCLPYRPTRVIYDSWYCD